MGRSGFSLHSTTMVANGVGDNGVLLSAGHRLFAVCLWCTGGANIKRGPTAAFRSSLVLAHKRGPTPA